MSNRNSSRSILPEKRLAGVSLHLTSLPGPHGIGDIGDAAGEFLDTLRDTGFGVWQFLPTGPTAYGDSPYQPLSAFAGNEMLIGVEPLLREGLLEHDETEPLLRLPRHTVDYSTLIPAKGALLAKAAERFGGMGNGELRAGFEAFLAQHDEVWLDDYALFRILKTKHGERPWRDWDRTYVHRDQAALRALRDTSAAAMKRIKFLQFLFDRQWRELRARAAQKGILLFADMPIYIALDSADAWAHPEMLRMGADGRPDHVAGVPPDYFSADGQLWGNPLYDWDYHAANGYRWWIDRLRHAASTADLVRIDHFRGFEAYWAVPAAADTARNGAWEPGPGKALFEALRAALGHLPIVAENLGVITPAVEALRRRFGFPGMHVLQFELGEPGFEPRDIEENSVCYTGTHDNDTTVGWFGGGSNHTRTVRQVRATRRRTLKLTGGSGETIHLDLIRLAFSSRARIAIAPLQDYLGLGSEARLNIPGTTSGNWRWRLLPDQLTPALRRSVREMIQDAHRD
jgi:4-alpha-glucanotransferase